MTVTWLLYFANLRVLPYLFTFRMNYFDVKVGFLCPISLVELHDCLLEYKNVHNCFLKTTVPCNGAQTHTFISHGAQIFIYASPKYLSQWAQNWSLEHQYLVYSVLLMHCTVKHMYCCYGILCLVISPCCIWQMVSVCMVCIWCQFQEKHILSYQIVIQNCAQIESLAHSIIFQYYHCSYLLSY